MVNNTAILIILILPIVSALISWFLGTKSEKNRDRFNILSTAIEFAIISLLYTRVSAGAIEVYIPDVMGVGLYLKLDMLRYIFIWVTSLIWFLTTIYSTQYLIKYKNRNRYYAFFMLTLGGTVGIFLSENLLNLFTFFEMMSFTSYILVIHDEDEYAHEAGRSYISMAIIGGLVLLMGLFLLYDYTGTLNISELAIEIQHLDNIKYLIVALIIIGFGVKASMVPLHVWLPQAHPAAPTPASAILSGILVKTGIFGILIFVFIIMKGDFILSTAILVIGFLNMFLGGFLALFQRNIKRILAYSSMSQIGYILVGIGLMGILEEHNTIAVYATLYHIFNHAIFKVLLFLCAGIIYMIIHDLSINVVRGFGKHKKLLKLLFLIGLFGIIGMPGFNGFISKTLLHEALAEAHHMYDNNWLTLAEIIFTLSSTFTVAYLLKIFYGVFLEENPKYYGQYREHIKKRAIVPMIILSTLIILIGLRPGIFLEVLNKTMVGLDVHVGVDVHFYTVKNISSSILTMGYGGLIFFGLIFRHLRVVKEEEPLYINPSLRWFNLEKHLYIPVGLALYHSSSIFFHVIDRGVVTTVTFILNRIKTLSGIKVKKPEISIHRLKVKKPSFAAYSSRKGKQLKYITNEIKAKKESALTNVVNVKKIKSNTIENVSNRIEKEHITFSEALTSIRERLNSLIYGVFIFAIMIIAILIVLVF